MLPPLVHFSFFFGGGEGEGGRWGWALIRGWALINFCYVQGGRLFEVGAYSRWALIRGWALNRINTVLAIVTYIRREPVKGSFWYSLHGNKTVQHFISLIIR